MPDHDPRESQPRDSLRNEIRAISDNVRSTQDGMRATTATIDALAVSLREVDRKLDVLGRQVLENTIKLRDGMTGGAEKRFTDVCRDIDKIDEKVSAVERKTTKWEAGGNMLYFIVTFVGGIIGWLASHFTWGGK